MSTRRLTLVAACLLGGIVSLALTEPARALPATPDLNNWKGGKNNCYNYALNAKDNDFKQPGGVRQAPGVGANQTGPQWCDKIKLRAEADGLRKLPGGVGDPIPTPGTDSNLVCLVGMPGTKGEKGDGDYHWFRKNGDGSWSHKPGSWPAQTTYHKNSTNTEEDVTDPRVADQRDGYTEFCGWYAVPKSLANPPMVPVNPPPNGSNSYPLDKSGADPSYHTFSGPDLDAVREHLPSFSPSNQVPNPHWVLPVAGAYRGMALESGPLASGMPPYLRAYNGVIAVYSDLEGTVVNYYQDDQGLEPYLRTFGSDVPGTSPWNAAGLAALLAVVGWAVLARRREQVRGV